MALLRALRTRAYAALWTAQSVSALGDWLYRLACVWWAMSETSSGTVVSTVAVFSVLPQIVFLLVGGAVVDRFPRVTVMIICDLLRAGLTGLVAVLAWTDTLSVAALYVVTLAFSFVDAFVGPAFNAFIPEIVPAEDLSSANALNTLGNQVTGIVGPALGAAFVASGGTGLAFGLDALTFVFSAVVLLRLRPGSARGPAPVAAPTTSHVGDGLDDALGGPTMSTVTIRGTGIDLMVMLDPGEAAAEGAAPGGTRRILKEIGEGLGIVRKDPWLWVTMLCVNPAMSVYAGLMSVSLPFRVKQTLHLEVGSLSVVQMAAAIGAVAVAVILGRRKRLHRRGWLLYGSTVVMGCGMMLMGSGESLPWVVAGAVICSCAINTLNLAWLEGVQTTVPASALGRVASLDAITSLALMPVGFIVAGWAVDSVAPALPFVVGGSAVAVMALLGLLHPRIWGFD